VWENRRESNPGEARHTSSLRNGVGKCSVILRANVTVYNVDNPGLSFECLAWSFIVGMTWLQISDQWPTEISGRCLQFFQTNFISKGISTSFLTPISVHRSQLRPLIKRSNVLLIICWHENPWWARTSSLSRLQNHTRLDTPHSVGLLDEWSVRRRDLCLTAYNTLDRHTSMPLVGFEPASPASERPETHVLDIVAPGLERCITIYCSVKNSYINQKLMNII